MHEHVVPLPQRATVDEGRRIAVGQVAGAGVTVYGRQETWEDTPAGRPQSYATAGEQFRTDGRPTAQWSLLAGGRSVPQPRT